LISNWTLAQVIEKSFVLCITDIEGWRGHEEVARMLGCSVETSKIALHKARMKLAHAAARKERQLK